MPKLTKWLVCGLAALALGAVYEVFSASPVAMAVGVFFVVMVHWWETDDRLKRLERSRKSEVLDA